MRFWNVKYDLLCFFVYFKRFSRNSSYHAQVIGPLAIKKAANSGQNRQFRSFLRARSLIQHSPLHIRALRTNPFGFAEGRVRSNSCIPSAPQADDDRLEKHLWCLLCPTGEYQSSIIFLECRRLAPSAFVVQIFLGIIQLQWQKQNTNVPSRTST